MTLAMTFDLARIELEGTSQRKPPARRVSVLLCERDTRFVAVSRGEQEHLQRYREHMGWEFPWYTLRDDDEVYRTYFIDARGDEARLARQLRPVRSSSGSCRVALPW